MPDETGLSRSHFSGVMRCTRCRVGLLEPSGREPHRFVCRECGQHFFAVMQLVLVSDDRTEALPSGEVHAPEPGQTST